MAGVSSGSLQAGFDGVAGVVVGGNEQHVALGRGCSGVTGQGEAAGEAGGEGEGEQGGAAAWFAIEEGELAQGDALWPEPGEGLDGDLGEGEGAVVGDGVSRWFF